MVQWYVSAFAVLGYGACSSLMLVTNKLAVHFLPNPSFVLFVQCLASWLSVWMVGKCGCITVDRLELSKLRAFLPVSAAFLACIYTNMKTLQYSNVDTFIVFRASTPLAISLCDAAFLGRELPGLRSTLCLFALLVGAVGYVYFDAAFVVHGYLWLGLWYVVFCFDQVFIKYVVDTVQVQSNWGRVYYTNLWASVLSALALAVEPHAMLTVAWTPPMVGALAVSCALGVAMSYFAFLCRAQLSATSFTIVGNACKVITVLINVSIWDKHATPLGLCCLFWCLVAAALYKQAPMRPLRGEAEPLMSEADVGDDEDSADEHECDMDEVGGRAKAKDSGPDDGDEESRVSRHAASELRSRG